MSTRLSNVVGDTIDAAAPEQAWPQLQAVLNGGMRPPHDARAAKLVAHIALQPCDVRLRPGRFELWHLARCRHHEYPFGLAAPVVHHLMRLMGATRAVGAQVGLIQRAGLGSPFPEHEERAIWIVPNEREVELYVREAPPVRGPHVAMPAPSYGVWAVPPACTRNEPCFIPAQSACPHCKAKPDFFRELESQAALVCPTCGRSFPLRNSRF
ncbi:MAG: hypothetical protein QM778_04485 [Myxococcales bacterium]